MVYITSSFRKHHDKAGVMLSAEWCFIETSVDAFSGKSSSFMLLQKATGGKRIVTLPAHYRFAGVPSPTFFNDTFLCDEPVE